MPAVAQSRRIYATTREKIAGQRLDEANQDGSDADTDQPKRTKATFASVCKSIAASTHETHVLTDMLGILGAEVAAANQDPDLMRRQTVEMFALRHLLRKLGEFHEELYMIEIKEADQVTETVKQLRRALMDAHKDSDLVRVFDRLDELHGSLASMKAWFNSEDLRELSRAIQEVRDLSMSRDYLQELARKYSFKMPKHKKSIAGHHENTFTGHSPREFTNGMPRLGNLRGSRAHGRLSAREHAKLSLANSAMNFKTGKVLRQSFGGYTEQGSFMDNGSAVAKAGGLRDPASGSPRSMSSHIGSPRSRGSHTPRDNATSGNKPLQELFGLQRRSRPSRLLLTTPPSNNAYLQQVAPRRTQEVQDFRSWPSHGSSHPMVKSTQQVGQILSMLGLPRNSEASSGVLEIYGKGVEDIFDFSEFCVLTKEIYAADSQAVPGEEDMQAMFAKVQRQGNGGVSLLTISEVFSGMHVQPKSGNAPEHNAANTDDTNPFRVLSKGQVSQELSMASHAVARHSDPSSAIHEQTAWTDRDGSTAPSIYPDGAMSPSKKHKAGVLSPAMQLGIDGKKNKQAKAPNSRRQTKFTIMSFLGKGSHDILSFEEFSQVVCAIYEKEQRRLLGEAALRNLFDSLKEEKGRVRAGSLEALAAGPLPTEADLCIGSPPAHLVVPEVQEESISDSHSHLVVPEVQEESTSDSHSVLPLTTTEKSNGLHQVLNVDSTKHKPGAVAAAAAAATAMVTPQVASKSALHTNQRPAKHRSHAAAATAAVHFSSESPPPTNRQPRPVLQPEFETRDRDADAGVGEVDYGSGAPSVKLREPHENAGSDEGIDGTTAPSIQQVSDESLEAAEGQTSQMNQLRNNSHFLSVVRLIRCMQRIRRAVAAFRNTENDSPPSLQEPLGLDDYEISVLYVSKWQEEEDAIEDFFFGTWPDSEDESIDESDVETETEFSADWQQRLISSPSLLHFQAVDRRDRVAFSQLNPVLQESEGFSQGSMMSDSSSLNPMRPSTGRAPNARQQFEKAKKKGTLPRLRAPHSSGLQGRRDVRTPGTAFESPRGLTKCFTSLGNRALEMERLPGETFSIEQVVSYRYYRGLRAKISHGDMQGQCLRGDPHLPCFCSHCLSGCSVEEPNWEWVP